MDLGRQRASNPDPSVQGPLMFSTHTLSWLQVTTLHVFTSRGTCNTRTGDFISTPTFFWSLVTNTKIFHLKMYLVLHFSLNRHSGSGGMEALTFLESRVSQVFLSRFIHTSLKKLSSGDSQTKRKGKGRINTPALILYGLTGTAFDVKGKKIHRLRLTSAR